MNYRADVDGLRAVAVLSVVAYHFGLPGAAGGYLGVDVFFVISGYLICGMIAEDLERGRFSLLAFYKRRIMRIFPALFAMFLFTSVLSYVFFLPAELKDYSNSLLSAILSASNFYFAKTAGYFDAPAETKPLLHTWSLGVEEQFYVICPLLLMAGYRFFRSRLALVLIVGALLSLAGETLMYFRNPDFAFYLSPLRAWELLTGAFLSMGILPSPVAYAHKNIAGFLGLALLLLGLVLCSPGVSQPLSALVVCAGAALVIASSETGLSWVGRLLSLRPVVFVGLISYSLYLWHWPLVVFQRSDGFLFKNSSSLAGKLFLVALSIAVAYASWKFIETPFRARTRFVETRRVFAGAVAAMAAIALFAGAALKMNGAPFRFPSELNLIASYLDYDPGRAFREGRCFLSTNRQSLDVDACMTKDPSRPNYLLIGDSHAAHLWLGLSRALPGVNVMQATVTMCRPVLGGGGVFDTRNCPKVMRFVFEDYLARERVDKVLLSASWKEEDLPKLAETIDVLVKRGLDVVVLGPIVEYDRPLPRLLVDAIRYSDPSRAEANRTAGILRRDQEMRELAATTGASYVSVYDAVCRGGSCDTFAETQVPLQFDAGHLTAEGSVKVAKTLVETNILR